MQAKHILFNKVGLTLEDGVTKVRAADKEVLWGQEHISFHYVFTFNGPLEKWWCFSSKVKETFVYMLFYIKHDFFDMYIYVYVCMHVHACVPVCAEAWGWLSVYFSVILYLFRQCILSFRQVRLRLASMLWGTLRMPSYLPGFFVGSCDLNSTLWW